MLKNHHSYIKGMRKEEEEELYPDRPGEPDCIYYLRTGRCGYASICRFNHPPRHYSQSKHSNSELPQREGQPDCVYFIKTGSCKFGPTCKYHHPPDRRGVQEAPLNTLGLPIREEKPCAYYLHNQKCKFGPQCKFDHPQPKPTKVKSTGLPALAANAVEMASSLNLSGVHYVNCGGPPPAWTYMPYFVPPQGSVAAQNWNGYQGNMGVGPVVASGVTGTNLVYNSMNPGQPLVNGPAYLSRMMISNLPERPDQPDCRYFMSTGVCPYGSNCKFDHPKGRIAHILGPHGLPLRPEEDICGDFKLHGVCNYGPSCKYHHPITEYTSNYYLNIPFIPYLNQPFFPSPRNSPVPSSLNISEWIQEPETVEGKICHNLATKLEELPQENGYDQAVSVSVATSEIPRDESD